MNFRRICLSDQKKINSIRNTFGNTISAMSFPVLFCWQELINLTIHLEDDFFVVKNNDDSYFFPCGNTDKCHKFIKSLIDIDKVFTISYLTEKDKYYIITRFDGFEFYDDRNNYDYIAELNEFYKLEGGKYKSIRKEIHSYKRNNNMSAELITEKNINHVYDIINKWQQIRNHSNKLYIADTLAEVTALKNYHELELEGILIRNADNYIGMLIGSRLNEDTIDVHFSKCIDISKGADYSCKHEFCNIFKEKYTYMNMEEDMGIEGLRTKKLLLRPKYLASVSCCKYITP